MVLKIIRENLINGKRKRDSQDFDQELPPADSGNASNPTPHDNSMTPSGSNLLLDKKAETYLRESANIEDLPDPQQELDADEFLKKTNPKAIIMANNAAKKQANKERRGDTGRTSSQSRKASSGRSTSSTNNKGNKKGA